MKTTTKYFKKVCLGLVLALCLSFLPFGQTKVFAAQDITVVHGTVLKGTTASLLVLQTPQGYMEIKIDSDADLSTCKLLLIGEEVFAHVYYGNDAYMHAAKITTEGKKESVTLDASTSTNVTATIKEKSTSELLYVSTPQGDMEIKLDPTTDLSGITVLVVGSTYTIRVARGADAYMHAQSISGGTPSSSYTPSSGSTQVLDAASGSTTIYTVPDDTNGSTGNIEGVVAEGTTKDILYLSTNDGVMQFKLDDSTIITQGLVFTPGNKLMVYYKYGNDEYWHATCTMGERKQTGAKVDSSDYATVTGTVLKGSTESILKLDTVYGEMELQMDTLSSISGIKGLVKGMNVSVRVSRGSDAYMHVLSITGLK